MAEPTIEIVIAARANQFKSELDAIQARLTKLETSVTGTGKGITKNFTKSTNQAQNALRDFSRVVQDAPFGIIGVGNNIQELAGSFGFLVRSTGGVRAALAGVIGALSGPGGLILLVSAVTTALTVFEQKNRTVKKGVQGITQTLKKLNEEFSALTRAGNLRIQIAEEGVSRRAIENARLAQVDLLELVRRRRQREIDILELQLSQSKAIREQKTLIGGITTLLEKAWLLTLGSIGVSLDGLGDAFDKVVEEIKKSNQPLGLFLKGLEELDKKITAQDDTAKVGPSQDEIDAQETLNAQKEKQLALDLQLLRIRKEISSAAASEQGFADFGEALLEGILGGGATNFAQGLIDQFKGFADGINEQAQNLRTNLLSLADGPKAFALSLKDGLEQFIIFAQRIKDGGLFIALAFDSVVDTINNSLGPAISTFGDILGTQLQQGVDAASALSNALIGGLSTLVSAVADELIRLGAAAVAIGKVQTTLESISPGPGKIAAGLAAIAVGTALKGIASAARGASTGAGAGGVSATGGGSTAVQAPSFAPSEQVVVFEIAGDKLIGVLNNTQSRNNRLSGSRIG